MNREIFIPWGTLKSFLQTKFAVQDEFGDLNPLLPGHYLYLTRKGWAAVLNNDFKVGYQDLQMLSSTS